MADPKPGAVATPEQVAEYRSEQEREYSQFVAVAPISFNGAPAYLVGDPVPASNVARHGYDKAGLVAKVGTKAAQELISSLHAATTTQQENVEQAPPVSLGVSVSE